MKILVAGSTGLVGSAILEKFKKVGHDVKGISTKDVDLRNRKATHAYLNDIRPEVIIDAAGKVGGIGANNKFPVEFLSDNLRIQNNLMDAAHEAKVERFIFLGSSCIYPKNAQQPIKEEYLLTGPLEETNSAYAIAKIAGIEAIKSFRRQYGHRWISLMPTNMYGPSDNFDQETGHVLPALINKFVSAKESGTPSVTLWGTGSPKREFLFSSDLADAVSIALERYDEYLHLNVGTGEDLTIKDLANLISREVGYSGEIIWDHSKPDGTPRKVLDVSRMKNLGWRPKVELEEGIRKTIEFFRNVKGMVVA
jgi:GDP-L-fucose synthase